MPADRARKNTSGGGSKRTAISLAFALLLAAPSMSQARDRPEPRGTEPSGAGVCGPIERRGLTKQELAVCESMAAELHRYTQHQRTLELKAQHLLRKLRELTGQWPRDGLR